MRATRGSHLAVFCRGNAIAAVASMAGKPYDIRERTFLLAREVVRFCRSLENGSYIVRQLSWQLLGAAASIGANLEEAAEAQSKPDFISKNAIALKECREALYWLRLIVDSDTRLHAAALPLMTEIREVTAIVATIVLKAKSNSRRGGNAR